MKSDSKIDIKTFLDDRPLSGFQMRIVVLGLLVLILDGFDTTAVGFIAPAIVADWGIDRVALSPVFMSGLFGLAVGALTAGPLGDKFGRKTVIVSSVFLFGVLSLASAFANDLWALTVLRFLTGLGLGASMPNTATLIAEYAPTKHRSFLITLVYSGFGIGGVLGGLASNFLIEHFNWRGVLLTGGILPIALGVLMIFALPESIRFLAARRGASQAVRNILRKLAPDELGADTQIYASDDTEARAGKSTVSIIVGRGYIVGTISLWVGVFMTLFMLYLISSWLPLMIKDAGMTLSDATLIATLGQAGGAVGSLVVGWLMDRYPPHKVLCVMHFLAGVAALCVAVTERTFLSTSVLVCVIGYCMNSLNVGYVAMAARYYPTAVRATGTSWEQGIGRFGAIIGAAFGGVLLATSWSLNEVFAALSIPMVIGMIAISIKSRFASGGRAVGLRPPAIQPSTTFERS